MKKTIPMLVLAGAVCTLLTGCPCCPPPDLDYESDSSGSKDNAKTPITSAEMAKQWVTAHNKYRRMHQVGDVKWSSNVAKTAQEFAKTCPQQHEKSGYGENMAWGYNGESIQSVVGRWYSEESKHDYNNNNYKSGSGHFTQVVWKNTTEIGCAVQNNCRYKGKTYPKLYVCRYNPAGNYSGQFKANVFPKK